MRVINCISYTNSPTIKFGLKNTQSAQPESISAALEKLKEIKFEKNDLIYMRTIGANPGFKSGLEAYEFIKNNNTQVKFAKLLPPDVHASWDFAQNQILISDKYKNSSEPAEILALSEAILHEAGHAKDKDDKNSIQEELDCLALNVLAHQFYKKADKNVFAGQNSFLFSEGVELYDRLFFKFDPTKQELKNRISKKYGNLPLSSPNHPPSRFALDVECVTVRVALNKHKQSNSALAYRVS